MASEADLRQPSRCVGYRLAADQMNLGQQGLGDGHQATGILVQAMHYAGMRYVLQGRAVVQQAVICLCLPIWVINRS